MYEKLPFDKPETITKLGTKLFTRIENEDQQRVIREFLSEQSARADRWICILMRVHKVHPVTDHRGFDLISDALPFGRLWYGEPDAISNAVDYAKFRSRSHDAVIRVYDEAGNVIETHEHASEFWRVVRVTN
jgi:hypothetical protein